MTRAIIYARTSGDDTDRDSLSAQVRLCEQHAEAKGYEVVLTLKEDARGVSGASFNVPQLRKALELAQQKFYDILIIRDVSRFSRDIEKFSFFEPRLRRHVAIEFVWNNFEDTPTGRFYKTISVGIAQLEKDAIFQRLYSGKIDKLQNKGSVAAMSRPIFGYSLEKIDGITHAKIVQGEAEIVSLIFHLYNNERMSIYEIAKHLEANAVPSYSDLHPDKTPKNKKSRPGEWSRTTINGILRETAYFGEWKYGKTKVIKEQSTDDTGDIIDKSYYFKNKNTLTVQIPAIITEEQFNEAQRRLAENSRNTFAKTNDTHLLQRRVKCACGALMYCEVVRQKGKEWHYYVCPNSARQKPGGATCEAKRINAGKIDNLAWEWVSGILSDKEKIVDRAKNYELEVARQLQPLKTSLAITEGELAETKIAYERLLNLWVEADKFDRAFLDDKKKVLRSKMEALQQQAAAFNDKLDNLEYGQRQLKSYLGMIAGIDSQDEWIKGYNKMQAVQFAEEQADTWELHKDLYDDNLDYGLLLKMIKGDDSGGIGERRKLLARIDFMAQMTDNNDVTVEMRLGGEFICNLLATTPTSVLKAKSGGPNSSTGRIGTAG